MHALFDRPSIRSALRTSVVAAIVSATACGSAEPEEGRGAGLENASLPAVEQAGSYGAALRTAFELGPGLSLLLDPGKLPRGTSDVARDTMPRDVTQAMLAAGVIQGQCTPTPGAKAQYAPICEAQMPGYVIRVSDVYELAGDTLQLHVLIRRYDTPGTGPHSEFAFEEAYQLVQRDGDWRVVRKARLARAGS